MRIARTIAAALFTLALAFTGTLVATPSAFADSNTECTVNSITHDI